MESDINFNKIQVKQIQNKINFVFEIKIVLFFSYSAHLYLEVFSCKYMNYK